MRLTPFLRRRHRAARKTRCRKTVVDSNQTISVSRSRWTIVTNGAGRDVGSAVMGHALLSVSASAKLVMRWCWRRLQLSLVVHTPHVDRCNNNPYDADSVAGKSYQETEQFRYRRRPLPTLFYPNSCEVLEPPAYYNAPCSSITTSDGTAMPWVTEFRYLGAYIVQSPKFRCSTHEHKKSFF